MDFCTKCGQNGSNKNIAMAILRRLAPIGQLLTAPSKTYTYDDNFSRTDSGMQIGDDNRLKEDNTYRYEYDGEGNLTKKIRKSDSLTTTFTYDHRNRLTQVATAGSATVGFAYDASDRRVSKSVGGSVIERYCYDGGTGELIMVLNGAGAEIAKYLYGDQPEQVLAEHIASQGANGYRWYVSDHQQSVRKVLGNTTDDNVAAPVLGNLDYDAFGNRTIGTGTLPRHQYTGQIYDSQTGLSYYGARYYDAGIGRFINQDPAEEGTNLYSYVFNDPMNLTDPSGMNAFGAGGFQEHRSENPGLVSVLGGSGVGGMSGTTWGSFLSRFEDPSRFPLRNGFAARG